MSTTEITESSIRALRTESAATGDHYTAILCDVAVGDVDPADGYDHLRAWAFLSDAHKRMLAAIATAEQAWSECEDVIDAARCAGSRYTTHGSVRLGCGHAHATLAEADRCLRRDQRLCRESGGGAYSDRRIYRTDVSEPNRRNLQDCGDLTRSDVDALERLAYDHDAQAEA